MSINKFLHHCAEYLSIYLRVCLLHLIYSLTYKRLSNQLLSFPYNAYALYAYAEKSTKNSPNYQAACTTVRSHMLQLSTKGWQLGRAEI